MLKKLFLALAGVTALALVPAFAEDKPAAPKEDKKDEKKELKLEGELVCVKCVLAEKGVEKCANALRVMVEKKEVIYYLDDKGSKEDYHEACCQKAAKAKLTGGTLTEKDGKKTIKGATIEVIKEKKEDKKDK